MPCQKCNSNRMVFIMAHCNDRFQANSQGKEHLGYVPCDLGIGGGDDVELGYCLDCGQIEGTFPIPDPEFITQTEKLIEGVNQA